jgi:hypothetical protein
MKRTIKSTLTLTLASLALCGSLFAGNEDRAGQAGGTELLINPWARSSGWGGANTASCRGLESQFLNVAGTAFTKKTELLFTHTEWLVGTDIKISSFGITQKVGSTGVLGLGIMAMNFGDIDITTVDLPEGGIGTYSPQFINIGLSYAKAFSDNIYGGLLIRGITEAISDVRARGIALDAGIQYVTGKWDHIKFGISLRNVGPKMKFQGDGLSFKTPLPNGGSGTMTVEQRSEPFELPSMVNIGGSYDIYFSKDTTNMKMHRLTLAGNFESNSFSKDMFKIGAEYGFKSWLMVRAAYSLEQDILKKEDRTNVYTGPSAGFTLELPFGKSGSTFALDYSYRFTDPFQGTHSIGARINL